MLSIIFDALLVASILKHFVIQLFAYSSNAIATVQVLNTMFGCDKETYEGNDKP